MTPSNGIHGFSSLEQPSKPPNHIHVLPFLAAGVVVAQHRRSFGGTMVRQVVVLNLSRCPAQTQYVEQEIGGSLIFGYVLKCAKKSFKHSVLILSSKTSG